jgi:hypothetical protein
MIADGSLQSSDGATSAPLRASAVAAVTAASAVMGGQQQKQELFYTPASPALIAARQEIAAFSFGRSAKRLNAERALSDDASAALELDRAAQALHSMARRITPQLSQVGPWASTFADASMEYSC